MIILKFHYIKTYLDLFLQFLVGLDDFLQLLLQALDGNIPLVALSLHPVVVLA